MVNFDCGNGDDDDDDDDDLLLFVLQEYPNGHPTQCIQICSILIRIVTSDRTSKFWRFNKLHWL